MPAGRPSDYTEEMANDICSMIAGGSNLNKIAQMEDKPSRQTIYNWFVQHPEFLDKYTRAREDRADWRSDRIDDIVARMIDGEIDSNVARVAIDAEKWQAGKEKPKRYGDKVTQEHTGPDGGPVKVERIERTIVDPQKG